MSESKHTKGSRPEAVSGNRRRLVRGLAVAVPTVVTLRSGMAQGMVSTGLFGDSNFDNAELLGTDTAGTTYRLCVKAEEADGYPGKLTNPTEMCGATSAAECDATYTNGGFEGAMVSNASLSTAGITLTDDQRLELITTKACSNL